VTEPKVPVTILTGFLGAGKTTLLNRILREPHGQRIAVIENEFGESGIDNELLIHDGSEQIVEMNNGCICCTVRGDLVRILGELGARREQGQIRFDRVIIETTGLADPAPVAQTFFVDDAILARYQLDGIVTVVDALHGPAQLDEHHEAQEQVGFADRLLVSKADLIDATALASLQSRLKRINSRAPVAIAHFGKTPISELLAIGGFDLDAALTLDPEFLDDVSHAHDDDITSFVYRRELPFDQRKFEEILSVLVQEYGADMLRYKGVLWFADLPERAILQGVHMILAASVDRPWQPGELRENRLVIIGRTLPRQAISEALDRCLVSQTPPGQ
jgi:G3E family GTPase